MDERPILITGASGFLAAWIIPGLLAAGRRIVALDVGQDSTRLRAVLGRPVPDSVQWVRSDITDDESLGRLFRELQPSQVIHLAALQIPACRADPLSGVKVNLLGHMHLLECARAFGARMIYTSSVAAKPRGAANAPANLYGVFKRADEEISRLYALDYGVDSFGLRPHVVYGVGRDQGETSVVTAAMHAAAMGRAFVLPWSTATCFQYAEDVAQCFVRLVESDWHGAWVSDVSDVVESTDDVIDAIRRVVPDADLSVQDASRLSPTTGFDTSVLRQAIGEVPRTALADGVSRTIAHFRRLGASSSS